MSNTQHTWNPTAASYAEDQHKLNHDDRRVGHRVNLQHAQTTRQHLFNPNSQQMITHWAGGWQESNYLWGA